MKVRSVILELENKLAAAKAELHSQAGTIQLSSRPLNIPRLVEIRERIQQLQSMINKCNAHKKDEE